MQRWILVPPVHEAVAILLHHLALVVDLHPSPIQAFPSYGHDLSCVARHTEVIILGKNKPTKSLASSQYLPVERIRRMIEGKYINV